MTPPGANLPLAGRTLIVTRPATQADALCAAIVAAGGLPLRVPLLEIVPNEDAAHYAPFATRLDTYALAFFVSTNAVTAGLGGIRQHRPWPPGPPVATVGPGSADALRANGFAPVIAPGERFDSEGVLALPEFSKGAVRNRNLLIVRGGGGRTLLEDTLRAHGARVDTLDCYHRRLMAIDVPALLAVHHNTPIDAIALTNSEATTHFVNMLKWAGATMLLDELVAFAPHPRIADNARMAGFAKVVLTEGADTGLLAGMYSYFGAHP